MKEPVWDVIVVGLGAVGSATLYQLSKQGAKVLGIDQFDPPHTLGSSHGETRITRLAVGEGEEYVALAKRSHEIWAEIEALSGKIIRTCTGGILIDSGLDPWSKHGVEGFWDRTLRYAQNQQVAHSVPPLAEIQAQYPAFQLPVTAKLYWEEAAGYLYPEVAIAAQLDLAKIQGAAYMTNTKVTTIAAEGEGFRVEVGEKTLSTKKIILSAGGWVKDLLPTAARQRLKICRQVLYWFALEENYTDWSRYPVWMWGFGPNPEDFIYGFPSLDGKTIKMASESFVDVNHPDELNRTVETEEMEIFWQTKVKGKLRGLKKQVVKTSVCFYTMTEDARFLLEELEGNPNFLWVSACSGHGFKHSAALGEVLARKIGY
jgi:sarcosine oxidase